MNKEWTPHVIAVTAFAVFIVLGLACASAPSEQTTGSKSAPSMPTEIRLRENKLKGGAELEINEETWETYAIVARWYAEKKGDYQKAIEYYSSGLELNRKDDGLYAGRGSAYLFTEDYDKAIADFTNALAIEPNNFASLLFRGFAYNNTGNLDKATADLEAVLRLDPNYAPAKEVLADIRKRQKQ